MSPVNHFGPAVIGQAAYEENKQLEESGALIFGPAVLGYPPEAVAAAEAKLGPAAQTPAPAPATKLDYSEDADMLADAPKEPKPPAYTALSIPELEKALAANPADFDRLYRGEFARPDGARKGALGVFLSHEQTHLNRPEVTEALFGMLKAKPKGGDK